MAYHATASSAIVASHVNKGLTTPGLKYVPTPGWETVQTRSARDRKSNRDGSKGQTDPNLVVNNLFEGTTFVQQSIELDDVRVLMFSHVSTRATGEDLPSA